MAIEKPTWIYKSKGDKQTASEMNQLAQSVIINATELSNVKDDVAELSNKTYNPEAYSGMGRVILRKNIVNGVNVLTQEMIDQENTIYIIQYDYNLNNQTITIPEGCILDMRGGSVTNGTINCVDTIIISTDDSKLDVTLTGTYRFDSEKLVTSNTEDINISQSVDRKSHTISAMLADRDTTNGMGYVILRKDKSFKEQVTQENTIYEIRYDFDLNGVEVEIPEDCVLKFEGGCLKNGNIIGNKTNIIEKEDILVDVVLQGNFENSELHASSFGIKGYEFNSTIPQTNALQAFFDIVQNTNIFSLKLDVFGTILIDDSIRIHDNTRVCGISCGEDRGQYVVGYTVIKKVGNKSAIDAYLHIDNGARYLEINNIRFADSYNITTLDTKPTITYGIYGDSISRILISNVNIYNVKTGIYVTKSYMSQIENVSVIKAEVGILVSGDNTAASTSLLFKAVHLEYIYGFAFQLSRLVYCTVIDCSCDDAFGGTYAGLSSVEGISFINCGVEANTFEHQFYAEKSCLNVIGGKFYCTRTSTIPDPTIFPYERYASFARLYQSYLNCVGVSIGNLPFENYPYPLVYEQALPEYHDLTPIPDKPEIVPLAVPNIQFINCQIKGKFPKSTILLERKLQEKFSGSLIEDAFIRYDKNNKQLLINCKDEQYKVRAVSNEKLVGNQNEYPEHPVEGQMYFDYDRVLGAVYANGSWRYFDVKPPFSKSAYNFPTNPVEGSMFFRTADKCPYIFDGTYWRTFDGYIKAIKRGETSDRPTLDNTFIGFRFFDTDLNKPIYWTGSNWVDATGAIV